MLVSYVYHLSGFHLGRVGDLANLAPLGNVVNTKGVNYVAPAPPDL